MNHITINGTIVKDATKALVNNVGTETPVVTFTLMDSGVPYQKNEPMFIEVHFMQEVAMHIFPYLIKGKKVDVFGHLSFKNYTTKNGISKQKIFINADYVIFPQ